MTTAQENYTAWLAAEIQAAIDDPRPSIPHEAVMAEMEAEIARLKEGNPTKHRRNKRRDDVVTSGSRRRDLSVTKTNPGALTPVYLKEWRR